MVLSTPIPPPLANPPAPASDPTPEPSPSHVQPDAPAPAQSVPANPIQEQDTTEPTPVVEPQPAEQVETTAKRHEPTAEPVVKEDEPVAEQSRNIPEPRATSTEISSQPENIVPSKAAETKKSTRDPLFDVDNLPDFVHIDIERPDAEGTHILVLVAVHHTVC